MCLQNDLFQNLSFTKLLVLQRECVSFSNEEKKVWVKLQFLSPEDTVVWEWL